MLKDSQFYRNVSLKLNIGDKGGASSSSRANGVVSNGGVLMVESPDDEGGFAGWPTRRVVKSVSAYTLPADKPAAVRPACLPGSLPRGVPLYSRPPEPRQDPPVRPRPHSYAGPAPASPSSPADSGYRSLPKSPRRLSLPSSSRANNPSLPRSSPTFHDLPFRPHRPVTDRMSLLLDILDTQQRFAKVLHLATNTPLYLVTIKNISERVLI